MTSDKIQDGDRLLLKTFLQYLAKKKIASHDMTSSTKPEVTSSMMATDHLRSLNQILHVLLCMGVPEALYIVLKKPAQKSEMVDGWAVILKSSNA